MNMCSLSPSPDPNPSGDHGLEGFRLQLVLPNTTFIPQHHHVQEVQHVQVNLLRCVVVKVKRHEELLTLIGSIKWRLDDRETTPS